MQGRPGGGFQQLTAQPGNVAQLQAQQMMAQSQVRAQQHQALSVQLASASNSGYSNYARLYAAQQRRLAEQQNYQLRAGR